MGRLICCILSLLICSTAFAKDFHLKGVLKTLTASPEITFDEKPHKYTALVLDKPISMNVDSEDTGGLVLIKNVSVIQIGWKAGYRNYMNKRVSAVAPECWDSVSGHVYTDVTCDVSKITILK